MTSLELTIPTEEHEGDFVPEALAVAVTLTRWGIQQEARDGRLVLSASDGVIEGLRRGHSVVADIIRHRGSLYRLARLTAG